MGGGRGIDRTTKGHHKGFLDGHAMYLDWTNIGSAGATIPELCKMLPMGKLGNGDRHLWILFPITRSELKIVSKSLILKSLHLPVIINIILYNKISLI